MLVECGVILGVLWKKEFVMCFVLLLLLLLSLCVFILVDWSGLIEQLFWLLLVVLGLLCWLIVYNLLSVVVDGLYYVEVLECCQGQQFWQFQCLVVYLVLIEQVLCVSIVVLLKCGGVYLESYQFVYCQWQECQVVGQVLVCWCMVDECLWVLD